MKRFFLITLFLIGIIVSPTYALPPGGGAESFVDLDDAPSTYSGQTGKYVRVKVDETGLEFGVPPGGGDMLAATFDADSNDAIDLNRGGTNAALTDPNADRIMFWRDSANAITWLTPGNGLVITTTTLNLDLTPTAGSATLWYNDDALEVKYDGGYFGEGANGLILDLTPSSGSATLQMANDAVVVKYDTTVMDEGANGLTLDLTPSSGSATLIAEEDALQVKYDTTLTEGVNGLGVSNTLTNSHLAANAAIALSKLATGSSAQFIVANGSGVPTYVTMSGDATLSNAGAITIANNKITGTHISLTNEATGDLMNYNAGTGNWEVLAAGTVNYPLVSTGTGAVPGYAQLTAAGIANNTITNSQIANNTIGTTQLAANLAFDDGDLIDLSRITPTGGVDEGLILPTYANVTPASDKPFITFDPSSNSLKVYKGGWVTIGASGNSGAPTDATYLTVSLDGTLSAERTLSAGLGIGASDGGVNGAAYTLTFAPSELGNLTWGTGSAATQAWTFDGSGATDPVLTAGDGYISVTTGELRESTRRVYSVGGTDVAVGDGGTGKSSWTQYGIPYNDTTTSFSQIAIGAGGYYLTVNGGATGYTWAAPLTMDTITDGSSYQKVAAADVNASNHVDRFYDSDGTGYITVTGLSTGRAKTFADVNATVMESGQTYGGLIFGTATPDSAGKIGYASNVVKYHDGTAARTLVAEGRATAGLIFGDADSIPDAAGEIAYNANGVQYYDTGLKTLANLEGAQTITGVKRIADNTNLSFGTDADWSAYYDETTSDNLVFSTAKVGAADTASAMFKILVNSGAGTLTNNQNVFEVMNNTTSLMKVDENGDLTIPGILTSGSTAGNSYISMGGNTGGRAPTAASYEIYFDGGTDLSYSLNGTEKTVARLQDTQTFTGAKTFTGGVYSGNDTTAASIRLYDGSSNYWTITSPAMSSNYTLTLPVDDGTNGQYLGTDGSGNLSWGNPSATAHGSDTYVQFNDGGTAFGSDAGFRYTKTTDTLTLGETGAAGKVVLTNGTNTATVQQGSQSSPAVITLPIVTSTLSTTDTSETISGIKTFSAADSFTAVNSAGGSANALTLSGTLEAFNGSDTFRGLYLNYTNANHTSTSNTVALIDIAAITGDAESNLYGLRIGNLTGTTGSSGEVERGISIGTGWDYGIYNSSLTYLGAATTFAGGSEDLTLTIGGSGNYAAFSTSTGVDTLAFTSIALGSAIYQPESLSNGSAVLRSGQTNTNTVKIQAYDTDGSFVDLITGTAGTTPTLTLAAAGGITISNTVTFNSNIELGAGTDTTLSRSSAGKIAVEGVDIPTISSTDTLTNKTFDANGTGNTLKGYSYIQVPGSAYKAYGSSVTAPSTTATSFLYNLPKFSSSADKANNYVDFVFAVPDDIDTNVDLTAKLSFILGGADTGDFEYILSMCNPAGSAAAACTPGDAISLAFTADASGADGDIEYTTETTLTGWRSAMTAGRMLRVRLERDGDHANDTSTVDSYPAVLTLKYGYVN